MCLYVLCFLHNKICFLTEQFQFKTFLFFFVMHFLCRHGTSYRDLYSYSGLYSIPSTASGKANERSHNTL